MRKKETLYGQRDEITRRKAKTAPLHHQNVFAPLNIDSKRPGTSNLVCYQYKDEGVRQKQKLARRKYKEKCTHRRIRSPRRSQISTRLRRTRSTALNEKNLLVRLGQTIGRDEPSWTGADDDVIERLRRADGAVLRENGGGEGEETERDGRR